MGHLKEFSSSLCTIFPAYESNANASLTQFNLRRALGDGEVLSNGSLYACVNGELIKALHVCNGQIDCRDGSDEWNCTTGKISFTIHDN